MAKSWVICNLCRKEFLKDNRHINENQKLGHKFYCSIQCQSSFRNKRLEFNCDNPFCNKEFMKRRCEASKNNYCSRSCAVTINNSKFPKRIALIKDCNFCAKNIPTYQLYCSIGCSAKGRSLSREEIINRIKRFYSNYGRVPLKREFWGIYKPARKYFGTWNKAIEAAGFKPNPIMFADNCIANDGHKCNSIAEKTIDDYLFQRDIVHERNIPYPKGLYTADFKIGKKLVEYFGLSGEHRRYDELKRIKKRIAKKYQLGLIEIYPKDLYPHNQLEKIFGY